MELKDLKDLMRFFDKSGLTEFELEEGETRVYLSKASPYVQTAMMPQMPLPTMWAVRPRALLR